jgi:hypothetical protein
MQSSSAPGNLHLFCVLSDLFCSGSLSEHSVTVLLLIVGAYQVFSGDTVLFVYACSSAVLCCVSLLPFCILLCFISVLSVLIHSCDFACFPMAVCSVHLQATTWFSLLVPRELVTCTRTELNCFERMKSVLICSLIRKARLPVDDEARLLSLCPATTVV